MCKNAYQVSGTGHHKLPADLLVVRLRLRTP